MGDFSDVKVIKKPTKKAQSAMDSGSPVQTIEATMPAADKLASGVLKALVKAIIKDYDSGRLDPVSTLLVQCYVSHATDGGYHQTLCALNPDGRFPDGKVTSSSLQNLSDTLLKELGEISVKLKAPLGEYRVGFSLYPL